MINQGLYLALCALIVLLLVVFSWVPILRKKLKCSDVSAAKAEDTAISDSEKRNVHDISEALRDLFFARVIGGGYFHSDEALRAAGEAVDAAFPYSKFIIASVTIETWGEMFAEGSPNWNHLFFILRNTFEHAYPGKTCAAEVKGHLIAIINLDELPESGIDDIAVATRRTVEALECEYGLTVTVAISRIYDNALELHKANQDVERVMEYLNVMGEDCPVTTYDELRHHNVQGSTKSFMAMESRLLSCVRAQDFTGMQNVFHELVFNEFSETKPTVDIFRFRVYGMVNTMLYLMDDIHDLVGGEILGAIDPGPRLTRSETLEEIVQVMDDIMDQLRTLTTEKQTANTTVWPEKIRNYVDENFRNVALTVSFTAAQFNLSSAYCSKLFREQYGTRLFDYIQQKRLDAAKILLGSGKNMKAIAEEVGFSSALTMSRAFKRYEGTTPGRMRDLDNKPQREDSFVAGKHGD